MKQNLACPSSKLNVRAMRQRLPEDLVLHKFPQVIFSDLNLTNKQAIQYGLISKDFLAALQKRPALNFDWSELATKKKNQYMIISKELKYVHSTLQRYREEKIHLESFKFKIRHYHDPRYHEIYEQCIDWAAGKNLKTLNLSNLSCMNDRIRTWLPESVFRVESFVQLSLMGWHLRPEREIVWPNLKRLCLDQVEMGRNEEIFYGLIRNCLSLEHLEIHRPWDYSSTYRLSHLVNLKHLTIGVGFGQETLKLNAPPNLESASFSHEEIDDDYLLFLPQSVYRIESLVQLRLERCELDVEENIVWPNLKRLYLDSIVMDEMDFEEVIHSCPSLENLEIHNYSEPLSNPGCNYLPGFQNLKTLHLDRCEGIDDGFFTDFRNQFPRLEDICLEGNPRLRELSISSSSLKKIRVVNLVLLKEAQFDVPNVAVFEFEAHYKTRSGKNKLLPKLSVSASSDGWTSVIKLGSNPNLTRQLNQELEQFMTALQGSTSSLHLT